MLRSLEGREFMLFRTLIATTVVSLTFAILPVAPVSAAPSTTPINDQLGPTLFRALATSNVTLAQSLFYPEAAYVALKTGRLPAPSSDYVNRLRAFFTLDIAAYHQLLASGGPAHYLRTVVDPSLATWIAPGVCENGSGYWHEPPIRLVYRQAGIVKSFAVDSLITWQNRWYVIHLGPNPRPSNVGTVDLPQRGPGRPGPAGGC
jgi:hypothetical protein